MKIININLKNSAIAAALLIFGATVSTTAQVRTQTQTQTRTETRTQDEDQMSYEDMFQHVSDTESHSALDLLKQDDNFSTFIELLEHSGLEKSLKAQDEITIFAPTNQAFDQMRKEEYEKLRNPQNRGDLMRIISAHMVPRKIYANEFQSNQVLESTDGNIEIQTSGQAGGAMPNAIVVGGAQIMRHDIEAGNGLIHVVNRIVRPDDIRTTFY